MLPQNKTVIILSLVLIVSILIAIPFITDIYQTQKKIAPQMKTESHKAVNDTPRTNVTDVFFGQQKAAIGSLQNNETELLDTHFVPIETARRHAEVELARLMYTTSRGLAGTNFSDVALYPDPVIVYDNSGTRQEYYKFYAGIRGFDNILLFTPANMEIGFDGGLAALGSSDFNSNQIKLKKAQEYYDHSYPQSDIRSVKLINSACHGEIVKLDLVPLDSEEVKTTYLDYGKPQEQRTCDPWVNSSSMALSDRIGEWKNGDLYYRLIQSKALAEGINLTEPLSSDKREKMMSIFQSVTSPLNSPR